MIELAILGLLKERPMHGYDLRKRLKDDFGPLANISYGSLYPALERLEKTGAIKPVVPGLGEETVLTPIFSTGSLGGEKASLMARRATAKAAAALTNRGGKGKKTFEITDKGNLLFEELLEDPISRDDPRGFNLRLGFAKHLNSSARIRLLERRRFQLIDRVRLTEKNIAQPARVLDDYELAIAEHALQIAQLDLKWIDSLLQKELAITDPGSGKDSAVSATKLSSEASSSAEDFGRSQPQTSIPSQMEIKV